MDYNIHFDTLPQGDPIIKSDSKDGQFIAVFLEKWNTVYDAETLMEYLDIIAHEQKEEEDYQDIMDNGIYDDVHATLFFKDKTVHILFDGKQSEDIALSSFRDIVLQWKRYLEELSEDEYGK